MVSAPPGFVRETTVQRAPAPPPGFVREQAAFQPSFDPRQMPSTGSTEAFSRNLGAVEKYVDEVAGPAVVDYASRLGPATARTVGHNLLPSIVGQETPGQGAMFDDMMIQLIAMGAGAGLGGAITKGSSEVIKGLGRGGMSRAGVGRFMAQNPGSIVPPGGAPTTSMLKEFLAPSISGGTAYALTDAMNPGQGSEFVDRIAGATTGAAAVGITGREATQNLILGNPKYRDLVMRDPKGTVGKVVGGVLALLATKGVDMTAETVSDAVDYVASLFESEEK